MHISIDDAAAMYARACRAWYGNRAPQVVNDKAKQLAKQGDTSGAAAWTKVAKYLQGPEDGASSTRYPPVPFDSGAAHKREPIRKAVCARLKFQSKARARRSYSRSTRSTSTGKRVEPVRRQA